MSKPYSESNPFTGNQTIPLATVQVGTVTISDHDGLYIPGVSDNGFPFTDYLVENRYEKDRHTYMAGVSAPAGQTSSLGSVAFFRLASPTLLWVADWTAAKRGEEPDFPDPTPSDSSWILLDEFYEPAMLDLGPDGVTAFYRISGTYVYGKRNPSDNTISDINHGWPPWMKKTPDNPQTVDQSKKVHGIIDLG